MKYFTCRDSKESCGCLWAAHTVLRHTLVHAIVLRPDVEHTQHLWGHPMPWWRAQRLSVVEPHHNGCWLAPHLTAETHRVAPCNVLLLQLHTHLGRLWKTKQGSFRQVYVKTSEQMLNGINQQACWRFNSTKHECCLWWHAAAEESGIDWVLSPSSKTWWLAASESARAH